MVKRRKLILPMLGAPVTYTRDHMAPPFQKNGAPWTRCPPSGKILDPPLMTPIISVMAPEIAVSDRDIEFKWSITLL